MVKVVAEGEAYLAASVQGKYSGVLQMGTCERHTTHVRRNNLQGSENEPDSITQQTLDCTTRVLSSADTAVVLCIVASADIVSAAEPNLRTVNRVKALGLLQESSITTSSRTRR